MSYLNAIEVEEYRVVSESKLVENISLSETTVTHLPGPSEQDFIYSFEGKLKKKERDGYTYYEILDVTEFQKLEVQLQDLIEMNPD